MSEWPELTRYLSMAPVPAEDAHPESLDDVIDVLVPRGQREVGRRWEANEITVAAEHAATKAAAALVRSAAARFPTEPMSGLKVLVTCADGEWHGLAAETVASGLASRGVRTSLAPASTHAAQLASLVHDDGYHAVAVSCSLPANLVGARKMVVAALDTGTPVIAGGTAFGADDTRARLLGATAWAPNAAAARSLVDSLRTASVEFQAADSEAQAEYTFLEATRSDVTDCLAERLVDGSPGDHHLVNAAAWMFRSLLAGLLCDDPSILSHQVAWQRRRADTADAPHPRTILATLLDCLPREAALAGEWVDAALQASVGSKPAMQ